MILVTEPGTSLVVQWFGLQAPSAGGMGSIPSRGTEIPHATAKKVNELIQRIIKPGQEAVNRTIPSLSRARVILV